MTGYNKTSPSDIVKDVNKLGLRPDIAGQAEELMKQVEYPVVFWMDAETDKNYAALHPGNPTQFWITVKPQTEQRELERIVLANLYKQVQLRKRYLVAMPTQEYEDLLNKNNDSNQVKRCQELIGKINAFASSLECEMYLAQFGIETSEAVREEMFQDKLKNLKKHVAIQQKKFGWQWYPEGAVQNIIDFGFYARFNDRYRYHLEKWVAKIKPKAVAEKYLSDMDRIQNLIKDAYKQYTGDNGEDCVNSIRREVVSIFELQDKVCVKAVNAQHKTEYIAGAPINIYSFVPDGYPHEELVLKCIQNANECLGLYREVINLDTSHPTARVTVSYDKGSNLYSYGNRADGYYILIFTDVILKLSKMVDENSTDEIIEIIRKNKGDIYVRDKLMKYAMFFIILHEYGHILHGDCDHLTESESRENRREKEQRADEFAVRNLPAVVRFQYRGESGYEFMAHNVYDCAFMAVAKKIALALRK